jgi:regulator of protease activity HflC (stomatin/prohibitin superfamily)
LTSDSTLTNFVEFLYKELQFALREAVGARTLDELLGDKDALDREIGDAVRPKIEAHGLAVASRRALRFQGSPGFSACGRSLLPDLQAR